MRKRVKNQICNCVPVCSGAALQPDATNRSPDVPTPHNSPVWNSANPISAAVVSTARPHSWDFHQPQIRPFWLLGCMLVITPKNMLIPIDPPPPRLPRSLLEFMAALLYVHAPQTKQKSPHFRISGTGCSATTVEPNCHDSNTQLAQASKTTWWEYSKETEFICGLTEAC